MYGYWWERHSIYKTLFRNSGPSSKQSLRMRREGNKGIAAHLKLFHGLGRASFVLCFIENDGGKLAYTSSLLFLTFIQLIIEY